jgi:hypothetical protein
MELEPKKVLRNRWNILNTIFNEWRDKEWWYTGCYDAAGDFYVSWYFVRTNLADQFVMSVFDPKLPGPVHWAKKLFTNRKIPPNELSLNYKCGQTRIAFNGAFREPFSGFDDPKDPKDGAWKFEVQSKIFQGEIDLTPTIPYFTKFDYKIQDRYGLLHFFHNRANGAIQANGKEYVLNNALTYQDHCWGRIPSKTGWHWLAVQNENVALASLVNYGAYSQLYTEVYLTDAIANSPRRNEWVRLDQAVSFEFQKKDKWKQTWRVTSPDMDLAVTVFQRKTDKTWIPLLINLVHTEIYVKAAGVVRVDGVWVETGDMFGVMEEHKGFW